MIPILLLIAGLIVWFATSYDTVGIILTIAGGVLVAVQALFLVLAGAFVIGEARDIRRTHRSLLERRR